MHFWTTTEIKRLHPPPIPPHTTAPKRGPQEKRTLLKTGWFTRDFHRALHIFISARYNFLTNYGEKQEFAAQKKVFFDHISGRCDQPIDVQLDSSRRLRHWLMASWKLKMMRARSARASSTARWALLCSASLQKSGWGPSQGKAFLATSSGSQKPKRIKWTKDQKVQWTFFRFFWSKNTWWLIYMLARVQRTFLILQKIPAAWSPTPTQPSPQRRREQKPMSQLTTQSQLPSPPGGMGLLPRIK